MIPRKWNQFTYCKFARPWMHCRLLTSSLWFNQHLISGEFGGRCVYPTPSVIPFGSNIFENVHLKCTLLSFRISEYAIAVNNNTYSWIRISHMTSQTWYRYTAETLLTYGLIIPAIKLTIKLKNYCSYNKQLCKSCTTVAAFISILLWLQQNANDGCNSGARFVRLLVVAAIIKKISFKFYRKFYCKFYFSYDQSITAVLVTVTLQCHYYRICLIRLEWN